MKRVINASLFSYSPYQKVPAYVVTNGYLKHLPITLSNSIVSKIVKGIQAWKSSNGICYHHIDADTSNQNPNNIAFIDNRAHGYIHNPQTELKLMRCYGLLVPTYLQGYRAEEAEHAMYSKLFKDLRKGVRVYTAQDILDCIKGLDFNNLPDVAQSVFNALDQSNIVPITKDEIYQYVSDQLAKHKETHIDDIKGRPDVSYVDRDTAQKLTKYLDSLIAEDPDMVTIRSLEAVKQFIEYNMISRNNLQQYYGRAKLGERKP